MVRQNARILRAHHIRRGGLGVLDRRGAHRPPASAARQSRHPAPSAPPRWEPARYAAFRQKYISLGMRVAEGRPLGHAFAVRIAVFGKVGPVGPHGVGDHAVRCARLSSWIIVHVAEDVYHLPAMPRAKALMLRSPRENPDADRSSTEDLGLAHAPIAAAPRSRSASRRPRRG